MNCNSSLHYPLISSRRLKYIFCTLLTIVIIRGFVILFTIPDEYSYSEAGLNPNLLMEDVIVPKLTKRTIPRILHQTYASDWVPGEYNSSILSWQKHHRNYTFMMWTDKDIDRLIRTEFSWFYVIYRRYTHPLQRADVARYFILYRYGGIYADMDVVAYRPLDPLLRNYSCILSSEPFLQSILLWNLPQVTMNSLMACSPRHPFFKSVIVGLNELTSRGYFSWLIGGTNYIVKSTGPHALTDLYFSYLSDAKQGKLWYPETAVYLAPPILLSPTLDPEFIKKYTSSCSSHLYALIQSGMQIRACRSLSQLISKGKIRVNINVSYSDHLFLHLGYRDGHDMKAPKIHIDTIIGRNRVFRPCRSSLGDPSARCQPPPKSAFVFPS